MWIEMAVNKIHQYHLLPEQWIREAGKFLEGLVLACYNYWLNGPGKHSWQEFVNVMHCCFRRSHLALSIACMWDILKQEVSVK